MRLSPAQTAPTVMVPAALPEIVSGFRLGFALTLLGTLIGEMFASQRGIGYMLVKSMETSDTGTVMRSPCCWWSSRLPRRPLLALERRVHGRFES